MSDDGYGTPADWSSPRWYGYDRSDAEDWASYVSTEVANAWDTFTSEQKMMLARWGRKAQVVADNQGWTDGRA